MFETDPPTIADILDAVPDALLLVASDGRITDANAAAHELFGYAANALVGQAVEVLIPPELQAHHGSLRRSYQADPRVRHMGEAQAIDGVHSSGRRIPLDIKLAPYSTAGGQRTVVVARDIRHLRDLATELMARNAELGRVNEKKDRFVGMAAHDLRNPLGAILGSARLLRQGLAGPVTEQQSAMLDKILSTSQFMLGLVTELLDISAIESGKLTLNYARTDIERLVQEALAVLRALADHKRIDIKLSAPGTIDDVWVDPGKIEQVLHNLVTNALKYSESGEVIEVIVAEVGAEIRISVTDHGQGIDPTDHELIFEPFHLSSSVATAGERSTGLGLAITRRIVAGHGGRITLSSAIGSGSTFTVFLPRRGPSCSGERTWGNDAV